MEVFGVLLGVLFVEEELLDVVVVFSVEDELLLVLVDDLGVLVDLGVLFGVDVG